MVFKKDLKYLLLIIFPGIYFLRKNKVSIFYLYIFIFLIFLFFILNFDSIINKKFVSSYDFLLSFWKLDSPKELTFSLIVSENDQSLRFHRPILPQKIEEYPYQKEIKIIAYILLLLIYFINFLIVLRGNKS